MKNLNKKILAGFVLSTMVATGVYAYGPKADGQNSGCQKSSMQSGMMQKGHHKGNKSGMKMFSVLSELNLTDAQKTEIKDIVKAQRTAKQKEMASAFTANGFDKAKFIKLMEDKKENKLQAKAAMIEKMYAVLDTKQKVQFKTLLELRSEKMSNRFDTRFN